MTIVIPGMVTISLLSLFYCSMLPETARKARMQAFERQYIAHRGFHDNRGECPENSLPAFERAIQMGYGIELDVQLTKDGSEFSRRGSGRISRLGSEAGGGR